MITSIPVWLRHYPVDLHLIECTVNTLSSYTYKRQSYRTFHSNKTDSMTEIVNNLSEWSCVFFLFFEIKRGGYITVNHYDSVFKGTLNLLCTLQYLSHWKVAVRELQKSSQYTHLTVRITDVFTNWSWRWRCPWDKRTQSDRHLQLWTCRWRHEGCRYLPTVRNTCHVTQLLRHLQQVPQFTSYAVYVLGSTLWVTVSSHFIATRRTLFVPNKLLAEAEWTVV